MESLQMDLGQVRLAIDGDPDRVISFNPNSLDFLERFYGLIKYFETKEGEYKEKAASLEADTSVDAYGLPNNMAASLRLAQNIIKDLRGQIDRVFGQGASQTIFGDVNTVDMFGVFLNGIIPYVQSSRSKQLSKYIGQKGQARGPVKLK